MNKLMVQVLHSSIGKMMKPLVESKIDSVNEDLGVAGVFDCETTDITQPTIEITEVALRRFIYNKKTNTLVAPLDYYNEYNEPNDMSLLTEEVQKITGITPEKVKGKKIDFQKLEEVLKTCDFLIAHNAEFDKDKVLRYLPKFKHKWLCSYKMIDWRSKTKNFNGETVKVDAMSLDCLALFFDFDYEAHRALNDVDATYHLLDVSNTFSELAEKRNSAFYKIKIIGYIDAYKKTEVKDYIKSGDLGYKFDFDGKGDIKFWFCAHVKYEDVEKVKLNILNKVREFNPKGADNISFVCEEN